MTEGSQDGVNGEVGTASLMSSGSEGAALAAVSFPASVAQQWDVWNGYVLPARMKHPNAVSIKFRALDVGALEAALTELVRRHGNLRTTFAIVDGAVNQVVAPAKSVALPILNLYDGQDNRGWGGVPEFVGRALEEGFNLGSGPLFRLSLLRVDKNEHLLIALLHRAIGDEMSARAIERCILSLYRNALAGEPWPAVEPGVGVAGQYKVQRRRQNAELDDHFSFWQECLRDAPLVTQLPIGGGRGHAGSAQSPSVPVTSVLPPELVRRLRTMLPSGLPFEMTMLTSFLVLVARYTGQDDIVVSFINHEHSRSCPEEVIGSISRSTLVRLRLPGDPRFSQLLFAVVNASSGGLLHDDCSQEEVIERLLTPRASKHGLAPRIHVVFEWSERLPTSGATIEHAGRSAALWPYLAQEVSPLPHPGPPSRLFPQEWALDGALETYFHVAVTLTEDDGITCEGHGTFLPAAGRRLLNDYERLLQQIAVGDHRLSTYSLLSSDEHAELAAKLERVSSVRPSSSGVQDDFEVQARRIPDRLAVAEGALAVTYAQLDAWANTVRDRLRATHLAPRDRVGLYAGCGAAAVAGVLGIWKADATVVPLEVGASEQRLEDVLRNSRLNVVLCERGLDLHLPQRLRQIEIPGGVDLEPRNSLSTATHSRGSDLATIFFGSERSPALGGVMLTHDAVRNVVVGLSRGPYRREEDGDRPLSVYLDSSPVDERFLRQLAALWCGHTVCIADGVVHARRGIVSALRDGAVDVVDLTGSGSESLPLEEVVGALSSRQAAATPPVLLIGALHAGDDALAGFADSGARVYAVYGPAEACSAAIIEEIAFPKSAAIPVGDLAWFVLDGRGQPVPPGIVGEMHLAGQGLFRGYYGQPELTESRVKTLTSGTGMTVRLYRTGHYARWVPGGGIELLGALRDHVDLSGYKIRIPLLEAVLARCPGVRQVALAVRDAGVHGRQLVAYVVPNGAAPTLRDLRRFLWTELPGSIWPAKLMVVAHLPTIGSDSCGHSGPSPADSSLPPHAHADDDAPFTEEKLLATAWAGVLGVERVRTDSSYWGSFEFLEAVEQLRAAGAQISTEQLRRNRTVEALATAMAAEAAGGSRQDAAGPPATGFPSVSTGTA